MCPPQCQLGSELHAYLSLVRPTVQVSRQDGDSVLPRYNVADLLVHIRNKILTGPEGKNLSKSDLYPNPKPEVLHAIYMRVLQMVYGIRLEHFYMLPVHSEVAYPQVMEGFLPVSNLFLHLDTLMPICRVNDFEISDILYPKAKRTSRFLSGIINFIHFREACRETYLEFLWQYKSSQDKLQQLNSAHQEALTKLERLDSIPVEEQAEFKQLSDDIQELQQVLNQDFRQKMIVLQEETLQKKSAISEKTKRVNELKLHLVSLKEFQESLKTKIVDSPEKFRNYKEKMKDTVQKLKASRQEVMDRFDIYRDSVEGLPACQLEVQLYQKKMQELAGSRDKLAQLAKENLSVEDQSESAESALKKLKAEESALRRLLVARKEKLAAAQFRLKRKLEDAERHKRTVIKHCDRVQEQRGAVCQRVGSLTQDGQRIKLGIQQLKDTAERERLKAREIFVSLRAALEKYHEGLEKAAEHGNAQVQEKAAVLKARLLCPETSCGRGMDQV